MTTRNLTLDAGTGARADESARGGATAARRLVTIASYLAALVYLAFCLAPLLFMVLASLKSDVDIFDPNALFRFVPTLANYQEVLTGSTGAAQAGSYMGASTGPRALLASAVVTIISTALAIIFGSAAAYGLARYPFRGSRDLAFFILSTRMAPPIAFVLPMFLVFKALNLLDTYFVLIIVYTGMNMSFVVWLLARLLRGDPAGARGVGAARRLWPTRRVPQDRPAAGQARDHRRRYLRRHLRLERVSVRGHPDRRQRAHAAGRDHRLLDLDGDPLGCLHGDRRRRHHPDLHPDRAAAAPSGARPHLRRGEVAMATVELRHVWKTYGDVEAVRDLSLTCHDGEFLCLLGPSGCGKSSTMRMVAGLEQISAGDLLMDSRRVNEISPRERDIAMVFENYALYPHLNVYDNIAMPLRARHLPRAEVDRRIREVAEILSIVPLLPRRIPNLSGGQKQRVGIGRAIVREPRLFIMDEPISHLEARLRADMRTELKRLHHRLGVTTLYVTHDQLEAVALADRIAVMHQGLLQQVGTAAELFDQPANEFVAGFIGSPPMNMLAFRSASVQGEDLLLEGDAAAVRILALGSGLQARPAPGPHKLGIRPVDIELRPPDGTATIRGDVVLRERLGDHDRFLIDCAAETLVVEAPPQVAGAAGDTIGLFFPPARVHLFEGTSGRRLAVRDASALAA